MTLSPKEESDLALLAKHTPGFDVAAARQRILAERQKASPTVELSKELTARLPEMICQREATAAVLARGIAETDAIFEREVSIEFALRLAKLGAGK